MKTLSSIIAVAVLALVLAAAAQPAFAQSSPSGNMQAPTLQPKPSDNDQPLPPALPGAASQPLSTAPSVAKPQTGDPTAQLFTAINANDYNSAQDAISRGADLNGENALGETPIDLSVSLNRNSITFMILAARNASGDDPDAVASSAPAPAKYTASKAPVKQASTAPVKLTPAPSTVPGNDPGTPNASAGFLGFGK